MARGVEIVTDARVDSVINEFTPTDGDRKIKPRASGGRSMPRAEARSSRAEPSWLSIPRNPSRVSRNASAIVMFVSGLIARPFRGVVG